MKSFLCPVHGTARLSNLENLPCLDNKTFIKYEGSISKCGDNADWDWGLYQDNNNEWVLMEADGPGCIFNFTQHRYPSSKTPIFRFYFDYSTIPQFEITPEEFGSKPPFLKPLADAFIGPDDNGRGPIRVVRSFVPMEFRSHCKVTSSIRLEGADKSLGQGGWGHITYQMYDSPDGLKTFTQDCIDSNLFERYLSPFQVKPDQSTSINSVVIKPFSSQNLLNFNGMGSICSISCKINEFDPKMLSEIWIHINFDNHDKPNVIAPFGTFFGCEYGNTPAAIKTALLVADFSQKNAYFSNNFPMPFFKSAVITVKNTGNCNIDFSDINIKVNTSVKYQKETTGYFTSSEYKPVTQNIAGKNTVIADVTGNGHMVYGVITGKDIECGCEGDVRIFIDDSSSPDIESDGSESWGSYGWGFVCPPQCNPFSAYNGIPDINDTWSELRLTFTDSYHFRSRLRFELEHGCQNDGGGFHSGQIFYYGKPEASEQLLCYVNPHSSNYISNGKILHIKDRFENGIHENYQEFDCVEGLTESTIQINIPRINDGIILKRVCLQTKGRMIAEVYVDNELVTEKRWLYPDKNQIYSLLEDNFLIPAKYTKNKNHITIHIKPLDNIWNECQYRIYAIKPERIEE